MGWSNTRTKRPRCSAIHLSSTGRPKGVMITHGNLINNLEAAARRFSIGPGSRGVTWLPPYHDMGLVAGDLAVAFSECMITAMPPMYAMQQPIRWLKAIQRVAATISGGPPLQLRLLRCINR